MLCLGMYDVYMLKYKFSFMIPTNCYYVQLRKVPEDDVRLAATKEIMEKAQERSNWVRGAQIEVLKGDQEEEHGEEMHLGGDEDDSTMQDHVTEDLNVEDQSRTHIVADRDVEDDLKEPLVKSL